MTDATAVDVDALLAEIAGIHSCLGAALARAEGNVVFDRLLDRSPVIEPAWSDRPV